MSTKNNVQPGNELKIIQLVWPWEWGRPQAQAELGTTLLACWEVLLSCHSLIDCSHMPSALMHIKIKGNGGRKLIPSCWDP